MNSRRAASFDVIVAGAGLAGLSVSCHMLARGVRGLRVLLVDPRIEFADDRTWCGWAVDDHPFRSLVEHRWDRWSVREDGGECVVRSAPEHPYEMISAASFYRATLAQLRESSFEVALGESVLSLRAAGEEVVVETTRRTVRAGLVLDSRWQPARGAERGRTPGLVQHFAGSWVSADMPTFDPGVATLMDFADSRDEVHFFYVLPLDERRALVESTGFGPRPWGAERHDRCLAAYFEKRWPGRRFTVDRREQGVIPMDVRPPSRRESSRIVPLGLRGGAARPSTGYAFLGIQRQAARIARALVEGKPVPALQPFSRATSVLDAVFLSLARRRPGALPGILVSLFREADPARLVRFLAGGGSLADALHVVARTPPVPMLREAGLMLARA